MWGSVWGFMWRSVWGMCGGLCGNVCCVAGVVKDSVFSHGVGI